MTEITPIAFPLAIRSDGSTVTSAPAVAVEALIEQLLFTNPGERLNRPTLGCGLIELVFAAVSDAVVSATQFQVQASLQEWLATVATVGSVDVTIAGGELEVTVDYRLANADQWQTAVFRR